jgi:hypothetical protein
MEMALAYTPGLKRKESTLVRKIRELPIAGEVLVKEGDKVDYDSVVAYANVQGKPYTVNASFILDCVPDDLERYMLKKEGSEIEENEIIAIKRTMFDSILKRKGRVLESPVKGVIEYVSLTSGQIIVREPPRKLELTSYIPGTITKVIPARGVIIEVPATHIQGIFGIGGESHGELETVVDNPQKILSAELVKKEHSGKVLVGGPLITKEALKKAGEAGVRGIIVGGIDQKDLTEFLGYRIGVAITGNEPGPTIIVTEGFGKMNMANKTFDLLRKHEGRLACINGATQIRAGVIRPEIIIPLSARALEDTSQSESESRPALEGLKPGQPIRIIAPPYFGALGHVIELPYQLETIETESSVRVLAAQLEDGRKVIVPRANVELIEE